MCDEHDNDNSFLVVMDLSACACYEIIDLHFQIIHGLCISEDSIATFFSIVSCIVSCNMLFLIIYTSTFWYSDGS